MSDTCQFNYNQNEQSNFGLLESQGKSTSAKASLSLYWNTI